MVDRQLEHCRALVTGAASGIGRAAALALREAGASVTGLDLRDPGELPFPVIAELRDSAGYVMLTGLGKSIFDYHAENVRSHQEDWQPLIKWLKKLGG